MTAVIAGFVKLSSQLKNALAPNICDLLSSGISFVLDFPSNKKAQRARFRDLIEGTNFEHELHFVDASDAFAQVSLRIEARVYLLEPPGPPTESLKSSLRNFQPPSANENFNVVHHERKQQLARP